MEVLAICRTFSREVSTRVRLLREWKLPRENLTPPEGGNCIDTTSLKQGERCSQLDTALEIEDLRARARKRCWAALSPRHD